MKWQLKDVPYVEDRDCIKLSSHGPGKLSMHIIINNWYFDKCSDVHNSNNKSFWMTIRNNYVPERLWHFVKIYKEKIKEIPHDSEINTPLIIYNKKKDTSETIDTSVYSSFRQFRLIWNTKLGKDRYLELDPSTGLQARFPKHHDDHDMSNELQQLRLFEGSMITMTANCKPLPDWITPNANPNQQNAIKNMVDINDSQKEQLINAVHAIYGTVFRVNRNQSTSKNSVYLDPIVKPYNCPICGENHSSNNARASISARGNMYIKCFASNKIKFIGKETTYIDSDADDNDEASDDDNNIGESFCGFDLESGKFIGHIPGMIVDPNDNNTITADGNNKLDENLQQNGLQRVPAHPIINSIINNDVHTTHVHNGLTLGATNHIANDPIYKLKAINTTSNVAPKVNEGQIIPPSSTTTIVSFLNGNTKFIGGNEYIVKEVYDSYERYRCGQGTKYSIAGGVFGRTLTSLGHFIEKKRIKGIKGDPVSYVTLKRSDPITNTNPVEALNAIHKTVTTPAVSALNILRNNKTVMPDTTIQPTLPAEPSGRFNSSVNSIERPLNPHEDILNFRDEYLTQDPTAETDQDNLWLCFQDYCKKHHINLIRFKKGRLIGFFKKWLLKHGADGIAQGINNFVLKGWKCKIDKEAMLNSEEEKPYRRIWEYNTAPYQIGWHNGKDSERYSKTMTPKWRKIDVHVRNDKDIKTIDQLIEMTKLFEEQLPDRIKEIKMRQFELAVFPRDPTLDQEHNKVIKECDNLKSLVVNSLLQEIIVKDSPEHLVFMNRINELENEALRIKTEALRINEEESLRLQESIKDDLATLRKAASWCIAVRSTFASGKTKNLKPFFEPFPDMKILIVLPRKTLTDEFMKEYRTLGFEIYTDTVKGPICGNRIIVCFPSIPRIVGDFDLLVLDEFKSILDLQHTLVKRNKSTGKYSGNQSNCYRTLRDLVANTKRVYVADALLTNAHVLEIAEMRKHSDNFDDRVTVYQNLNRLHQGKTVFRVNNQNLVAHEIIKCLRRGMRVTLADNSKTFAEYMNKKIIESDLNITTKHISAEQRAIDTLDVILKDIRFISYTPTILSGNSYTEAVDVVFGNFITGSCDQADALQMLMRCRNVTSENYYICVTKSPNKTPIPDYIPATTEAISNYLVEISKSTRLKNTMKNWPVEYLIPINLCGRDRVNDCVVASDPCWISYVNYMKQCVIAEREYEFRMFLYMRDCGFAYGGNIYAKTEDKEPIADIKAGKSKFKKERSIADTVAKSKCTDLTTAEYIELNKKTIKSKEEKNRCYKYRTKRYYKVDNLPIWFIKAIKYKSKMYSSMLKYLVVNGIIDQKQRYNLMYHIRNNTKTNDKTTTETETLTANIINSTVNDIYDAFYDIHHTWTRQDLRLCEHALNILKVVGAETFIRDIHMFEVRSNEFDISHYKDYIVQNEKELRQLVNDHKISIENLGSKITNNAFGIKFAASPTGSYNIINKWILNQHNCVWPFNKDPTDREELRILVPEPSGRFNSPTVSDKVTSWIKTKVPSIDIVRGPPIGTSMSINKVLSPVTPMTKVTPVIVQTRNPAHPIYINNIKLAAVQ